MNDVFFQKKLIPYGLAGGHWRAKEFLAFFFQRPNFSSQKWYRGRRPPYRGRYCRSPNIFKTNSCFIRENGGSSSSRKPWLHDVSAVFRNSARAGWRSQLVGKIPELWKFSSACVWRGNFSNKILISEHEKFIVDRVFQPWVTRFLPQKWQMHFYVKRQQITQREAVKNKRNLTGFGLWINQFQSSNSQENQEISFSLNSHFELILEKKFVNIWQQQNVKRQTMCWKKKGVSFR